MSIFDKLLRLRLLEDLTETTLWADTVFRGLEQDDSDEDGIDFEDDVVATHPANKPTYQ